MFGLKILKSVTRDRDFKLMGANVLKNLKRMTIWSRCSIVGTVIKFSDSFRELGKFTNILPFFTEGT